MFVVPTKSSARKGKRKKASSVDEETDDND